MKKTALLLSAIMVNVMFSFAQTQTKQAATTTATAKVEKAASACKNKKTSKKLLKRGNYE